MAENRPNLIFIMCDQLRFDCLGYAGHPLVQTPNLDRLAEQGVVFDTAYCASPICSASRASWLTSEPAARPGSPAPILTPTGSLQITVPIDSAGLKPWQ